MQSTMKSIGVHVICLLFLATVGLAENKQFVSWPEATQSAKPWIRWWWHGAAVDQENLSRLLEEYDRTGIGGVEVTCIYAVKGNEGKNRNYRSQEWIDAVSHTLAEAKRLGLGVDLPAGSGWRMGGPNLKRGYANSRLVLETHEAKGPGQFHHDFGKITPQAAIAFRQDGKRQNLSDNINENSLSWVMPAGDWRIVTAGYRWAGDRVKRPSPGGEGYNINPFWKTSVNAFLADFGSTLDKISGVRAQFHDSFEYEGDWQPEFFDAFAQRRNYRLETYLAELSGIGKKERVERVKADYRETLSDLVLEELVQPWVHWSHQHGSLARNQSHGSPANWLDLYAACDLPETESFGRLFGGDTDLRLLKFASSAANVTGKPLVSSETGTWLEEHFHVTLSHLKQLADRQMLAGVNHVIYHGTAYSPKEATWPGWLFYASSQLNPQNPLWCDLPALNAYLTRSQSLLQEADPDNDLLLYWPLHDTWHNHRGMRIEIRVHNSHEWFEGHPVGDAAEWLLKHGHAFDYVSDRMLAKCEAHLGKVLAPGGRYKAILVPAAKHMPLATIKTLEKLARSGCKILLWKHPPKSLPGLKGDEAFAQAYDDRKEFTSSRHGLLNYAKVSDSIEQLLNESMIVPERWVVDRDLATLRKKNRLGTLYLIVNQGSIAFDDWINPRETGLNALLLNPDSGQIGIAQTKVNENKHVACRIQLDPGETCFLQLLSQNVENKAWLYSDPIGKPTTLDGDWDIQFLEGGPTVPQSFKVHGNPEPWIKAPDDAAEAFAGTVQYSIKFDAPESDANSKARSWLLNLGKVKDCSTRVLLNGREVGVLLGPTYSVVLEDLLPVGNRLDIEVTGVAANRIRDLDRRGIEWRIFEDINLVTINYRPFDASKWPVRPLGLSGPVTITPLGQSAK